MSDFWQRPDIVEQFANRDPDHRLVAWCEARSVQGLRVLDLGCAAGRNTVYLAEQGADVCALDASPAMIAKTQTRLQDKGFSAAAARVQQGSMTDLRHFAANSFDWVIALGVYHTAANIGDWQRAIAETARVLKPAGEVLFSQSAPGPKAWQPVPGQAHLFAYQGVERPGFERQGHVLLSAAEIDQRLATLGLLPVVDTYTVTVPSTGAEIERISVNGHYRLEPVS